MNPRRIARIEQLIKARVAEILAHDISDPRRGMITISRVKVDAEMSSCLVFWSVLGGEKERKLNAEMLADAAGYVQREVAKILHTRTVPRVKFLFDESIQGAIRVQKILNELRAERGDSPESAAGEEG